MASSLLNRILITSAGTGFGYEAGMRPASHRFRGR
jgi:hypothetical protein